MIEDEVKKMSWIMRKRREEEEEVEGEEEGEIKLEESLTPITLTREEKED